MLDFQQKRKVKSFMYNRVTIGLLFVFVLYASFSTFRVYKKQKESEYLRGVVEKKVYELEAKDRQINEKIQDLDTDQGLEREIRGKFNVAKDDENMVIILENEEATTTDIRKPMSFWQKVLGFFSTK